MEIVSTKDTKSACYNDAMRIREQVFMLEQKVPKEIEIDQYEEHCIHFVLYVNQQAIATCRLLPLQATTVKLQRMAVLKAYRGQDYGRLLIAEAERFAKQQNYQAIVLGAQDSALEFYQKLGYHTQGEPFIEAGILHHPMCKSLI